MAAKRLGLLGINSYIGLSKFGRSGTSNLLSSTSRFRHLDYRLNSELVKSNVKRLFLVDTLALVRRLEGEGVPTKQAEAITNTIMEVLNDSLVNVSKSFVSKVEMQGEIQKQKGEMQKTGVLQESNLSKFKSEVQISQGHHFSMLQQETEKLRNDTDKIRSESQNDIEKIRSELRYEIDKVTAGQRLDLNLERGRIREELSNQSAETSNLTNKFDRETSNLNNKLDREIHALRAQLEAAKYDVIKYCIGTLVSISTVGLALLRILM